MLKPSVINNVKRAKAKGVVGNLKGEGKLLGGLLVVGAGNSGVAFEHREKVRRCHGYFRLYPLFQGRVRQ